GAHAPGPPRLDRRGAQVAAQADRTFRPALEQLAIRQVGLLLLEGGAEIHRAAWDEELVDFVRLYVTPHMLGPGGLPFLGGRRFAASELVEARVETLGPDVLMEGYVHRPY